MDIANLNNGVVTSEELNRLNIHKGYLRVMIEKGMLERSTRGVYILPERLDDELFNLQNRFKKGVFLMVQRYIFWVFQTECQEGMI